MQDSNLSVGDAMIGGSRRSSISEAQPAEQQCFTFINQYKLGEASQKYDGPFARVPGLFFDANPEIMDLLLLGFAHIVPVPTNLSSKTVSLQIYIRYRY